MIASLLGLAGVFAPLPAVAGVDVIFVPGRFPAVCAWSLTEDRARCPDGVTGQVEAFCRLGLSGLDSARSALGLRDCQGNSMPNPFLVSLAESTVELVLLVDDSNPSSALLEALGPTLVSQGGRRMIEPSFRVFTDTLSRSRRTLVVGEQMSRVGGQGGGAIPTSAWQERIRGLLTQGGELGRVVGPGALPENRGDGDSTPAAGGGSAERPAEGAGGLSVPSPGRGGGDGDRRREAPTETGEGLTTPTPSPEASSFTFEEREVPVPFHRSFVRWRDAVGRALASEIGGIERSAAYSAARRSDGLRRLHGELSDAGVGNGEETYVPVTVMRNTEGGSVESIAIYDDEGS